MVSGAANGGVRVWDVINGECLQHLRGHVKSVTSVDCTAEHLLSVSLESVLCIWDRSRGECMHRLKQVRVQCFALYSVKYAKVRSYALCLRVQHAAAKLIFEEPKYFQITPLFYSLHLLPVVALRGRLQDTVATFAPERVHSGFLSWLYICLHDTTTKCHAGASHPDLSSPMFFVPAREFHSGTKSRNGTM